MTEEQFTQMMEALARIEALLTVSTISSSPGMASRRVAGQLVQAVVNDGKTSSEVLSDFGPTRIIS